MGIVLRILTMFSGLLVFAGVVRLLVKRKLDEADSFLWLCIGVFAIIAGCFPEAIGWLAGLLGIGYPPTLVLLVSVGFLLFVIFKNTINISEHKTQNHELSMQVSMLNSEVKHLIEQCSTLEALLAEAQTDNQNQADAQQRGATDA